MKLKKIAKSVLLPFFFLINLMASASMAFAAQTPARPFSVGTYLQTKEQKEAKNPIEVGPYIIKLINFLAMLIGSCAFLAIIIGGMMLVASGGKEAQITKGKDIIKYAITGLLVAMAAYFITSYVQSIFYEYKP